MGFFDNLGKALSNIDYDELAHKVNDACEKKVKEVSATYRKELRTYSDEKLQFLWDKYGDEEGVKSDLIREEMERRHLL